MRAFSYFVAIDWSGAKGAHQSGIAVALCYAGNAAPILIGDKGRWSRAMILEWLKIGCPANSLIGLDLGISLPFADCGAFFPGFGHSPDTALALWEMVDRVCADDPCLSAGSFVAHPDFTEYFRRPGREGAHFHVPDAKDRRGRFRVTELAQAAFGCRPYSNFNLVGAAQVGKSSLTGMRVLNRLRGVVPVWPIDPLPPYGSVIVEIYTTLAAVAAGRSAGKAKMTRWEELDQGLIRLGSLPTGRTGAINDHSADALLTSAWLRQAASDQALWHPADLTAEIARTEGWTFGAR